MNFARMYTWKIPNSPKLENEERVLNINKINKIQNLVLPLSPNNYPL